MTAKRQKLYTTLLCLLIALVSASSFEMPSTTWSNAYVSKNLLSLTGVQRETITATSNLRCVFLATTKTWANLYCFLKMENECVITELLRAPSDDSTGLQDPILCKTRFAEKGARLCTKHPNMEYIGYGCLQVVRTAVTWTSGRTHCQSIGMDLVSFEYFTSQSQLDTVADHLGLGSNGWYSVGFKNNLPDTTKFYWLSGTEFKEDHPLWKKPSEPNHGVTEDVGMLEVNGGLCDINLAELMHFICSFP